MGQQIYDPTTKRLVTVDEANQIVQSRRDGGEDALAIRGPVPGQQVGFQMPPSMPNEGEGTGGAADILNAFPQLAGIIASFTPVGKAGYTASGMVPAVVDMVQRAIRGEPFDAESAALNFAGGVAGHGVGNTLAGVGKGGAGMVRRSLGLTGGDEVLEQDIPRRLIKEKAEMSIPGVAKIREKVDATGDPWLKEAADALAKARYKDANSPNLNAGGLTAMAGDVLLPPPRQMAIGSALTSPFGVSTEKVIAPTAETGLRALLALIASQLGMGPDEAPAASGPRRRER